MASLETLATANQQPAKRLVSTPVLPWYINVVPMPLVAWRGAHAPPGDLTSMAAESGRQRRDSNEMERDLTHIGSWAGEGPVTRPGANMPDATTSTSTSTGPSVSSLLKNYSDSHDVSPMVHVFLNESQDQSKLYTAAGRGK